MSTETTCLDSHATVASEACSTCAGEKGGPARQQRGVGTTLVRESCRSASVSADWKID